MSKPNYIINKMGKTVDTIHEKRTFVSQGYLDYLGGSLFVLLALLCMLYIRKSREKAENYKTRQLEEYIRQNPRQKNISYEETKMYLPPWERAKQFMPIMGCIIFALLALVFFTGKPISLI